MKNRQNYYLLVIAGLSVALLLYCESMLIVPLIGLFLYFVPSIVGMKKQNARAIFVLNFFLGWTFIGWVIALVWAVCIDKD